MTEDRCERRTIPVGGVYLLTVQLVDLGGVFLSPPARFASPYVTRPGRNQACTPYSCVALVEQWDDCPSRGVEDSHASQVV